MREVVQEAVTDPFPTPAAVHPPAVVEASAISQAASAVVQASLPALIQPLGGARYKVQFTASAELRDKLERLRALMRSQVPDGDLATIIERAVTEKLERLEARRFATTSRPRTSLSESATAPSSRHIPAAVRRAVYERDAGRCRYVDESGRRCSERDRLEYHRHPFAAGGDHSQSNTRLMCRGHNAYLAEHDYGREAMARYRRSVVGERTRPVDRAGGDPGGHESLNQTRTPTYIVPA
jgi:5-methylcytosine-specific restriction endonuclease McrA